MTRFNGERFFYVDQCAIEMAAANEYCVGRRPFVTLKRFKHANGILHGRVRQIRVPVFGALPAVLDSAVIRAEHQWFGPVLNIAWLRGIESKAFRSRAAFPTYDHPGIVSAGEKEICVNCYWKQLCDTASVS